MKTYNISKLCAGIVCALSLSANATSKIDVTTMAKGYTSNNINQVLGVYGNDSFKATQQATLGKGFAAKTKVRFQQYYKGIPV